MDIRKFFDSKYLSAADFDGSDITVTIKEVRRESLQNEAGEEHKPVLYFSDHPKPLVLNKVNTKAIAAQYGWDTDNWVGQRVTFKESITTMRGEEMPCVRVKPW